MGIKIVDSLDELADQCDAFMRRKRRRPPPPETIPRRRQRQTGLRR